MRPLRAPRARRHRRSVSASASRVRPARQLRRRRRRRPGATRRPAPRPREAQLGRRQALPDAPAQALGGQQVQLGVERAERAVRRSSPRRRRGSRARCSTVADPVERAGDGVGAPRTRRAAPSVSPLQPVVALGPAGVVLALGAAVARVRPQLGRAAAASRRRRPRPTWRAARRARAGPAEPGAAQRGGQVAAAGRVARVERLRDPQPVQRLDRRPGSRPATAGGPAAPR